MIKFLKAQLSYFLTLSLSYSRIESTVKIEKETRKNKHLPEISPVSVTFLLIIFTYVIGYI